MERSRIVSLEGLPGASLTYPQKFSRLMGRMQDPQWRRYGGLLLAGKMLGLAAVLGLMFTLPTVYSLVAGGHPAIAQETTATAPAATAPAAAAPATAPAAASAAAPAPAAATPAPAPIGNDLKIANISDVVNPLNTVWTLVAAFLVFGMQVGFTMLEAGLCRARETVNVLVECVFDTCLCGLLYWAWGYAFMFGAGNGFIGWHDPNDTATTGIHCWFFLQNIDATTVYGTTGVALLAHWIFQFAFADCASTICSGAMVGRTNFWGDILYSVAVSGFIYPILGHWAWGPDGFLYTMGAQNASANAFTHFLPSLGVCFHDFAGSTIVHAIGGAIALAGAIILGPRLGRKFKRDGGGPMTPHDLTITVCGGLFLWFGWYGFNPGSTLSAMDMGGIGRVAANTTLAACSGGILAVFVLYVRTKKWDACGITNGFLAGLVAITCPCYWVSPTGAVAIGAVAGIIVIVANDILEHLRIDDPIGAVPVHLANGIWGTLSLGLFACGKYSLAGSGQLQPTPDGTAANPVMTGLFYGGGTSILVAQAIGTFTIAISAFVVAIVIFKALDLIKVLRVTRECEIEGLDLCEHGMSAYPEYQHIASANPGSAPTDGYGVK